MNIDEVKQKLEETYPDLIFAELTELSYLRDINCWIITTVGTSKIDEEINTFFFLLVSSDFNIYDDLQSDYLLTAGMISYKYHFGKVIYAQLDSSNSVHRFYSIDIPSMLVLKPFSINTNGQDLWGYGIPGKAIVVAPIYQEIREFSEDRAAVKLNGKWGFIDRLGHVEVPLIYDAVIDFCYDERIQDFRYINYDFKNEWSDILFKKPMEFTQYFAPVKLDSKWGFVNKQGEITVPIIYDEVYSYKYGYALVQTNGKWKFIDRFGVTTFDTDFDEINGNYEWFTPVRVEDKWGYITRNGKSGIFPKYQHAAPFKFDIAIVQSNNKWGYIDRRIHPIEDLEEMSKHFTFNTMEEAINAVDTKFVLGKLKEDSYRYS